MTNDYLQTAGDAAALDRKVIRVDFPMANAGITAALRRAFEDAAQAPSRHDFEDLLRRLN